MNQTLFLIIERKTNCVSLGFIDVEEMWSLLKMNEDLFILKSIGWFYTFFQNLIAYLTPPQMISILLRFVWFKEEEK